MTDARRVPRESKKPAPSAPAKADTEERFAPAMERAAGLARPAARGFAASGGIDDDALGAHEQAHLATELRSGSTIDALRRPFGGAADRARVFAGPQAARVAEDRGASALAHGRDVFFAAGAYQPDTLPGRALLAHELAHVAQQRTGGVASGPTHEAHANRAALAAVQGQPVGAMPGAGLSIQRCSGFDPGNRDHVARARVLGNLFEERRRLRASSAAPEQLRDVQQRIDDEIAALRRAGITESEQEIEDAVRPYATSSDAASTSAASTTLPAVPPGPLLADLGRVTWERDDGKTLVIYGANGIGFARSDGLMLRAVLEGTGPGVDPALAPPGPLGRTPVTPVAPEPMLGLPGQGRSASSLVTIGNESGRRIGMVVDVGGAATSPSRPGVSCVPLDNITALQGRMGIGEIRGIAITHLHSDHIANIVEFIAQHNIPPGRVYIADAWSRHEVLRQLRATTDARLTANGWSPTSTLGEVSTRTGATSQIRVSPEIVIDVLFAPTSMQAHETAIANEQNVRAQRAGGTATDRDVRRAAQQTSSTADAASLVYVVRNPLARSGVMYLQDMRGETVTEIRDAMETTRSGSFAEALRGITVLNGFGHHFGLASGEEATDVGGMRTLVSTLMSVNHQLTIVVQADQRSFTSGTRSSPLLRFAQTIGARVVLVLEGTSDAIIGSDMQVQLRGPDVVDTAGEQRARDALQRIAELEQAQRTLENRGDFGRRELGLEGTAEQALADIRAEIARLSALHAELTARAALTYHEETTGRPPTARATRSILGTTPTGAPAPIPREVADILTELGRPNGPQFTDQVRARLQALARTRSAFGLESTLGGVPRGVADAMGTLPPLLRDQLNAGYERVRQSVLAEGVYAEAPLLALEGQVRELRAQLDTAQQSLDASQRGPLTEQIAELDRALSRIAQERAVLASQREVSTARAALGAPGEATTEGTVRLVDALVRHQQLVIRALAELPADAPSQQRQWLQEELAAINESLGAGTTQRSRVPGSTAQITTRVVPFPRLTAGTMDVSERALGGLMVYHSIEGLDRAIDAFQLDEASLAQTTARVVHAGGGIYVGTRMLRGYPVGTGSFAVLSAIDVIGTAVGDYETDEEWQRAFWTSVTRNSFQLAFLGLSQVVTRALVPRLGPLGVAIGLAVVLVVDPLLDWLGVYDIIERSTGFLPADVIDVQIGLRRHIDDYRIALGALQLARRNEADLREMGSEDPEGLRERARAEVEERREDAEDQRESLLEEFDEGYEEARTAHAGLQELDQLRQYFQQLVDDAELTTSAGIPAGLETSWHFQDLDATLGMGDMSDEDIDDLDQWDSLRDELSDLEGELSSDPGDVDWDDVREHQEHLRQMFGNARYRLDPSSTGGGLREQPLLPEGRARTRYLRNLSELEARWFAANRHAMRSMRTEQQAVVATYPEGATRPEQGDPEFARPLDAITPVLPGEEYASQLRFLEDATAEYERLLRVQPPLPGDLTAERLYSDFLVAGLQYRAFVADDSRFRDGLERLRAAEVILTEQQTRVREAGQSLDPTQRQAQMMAIQRSRALIDARRVDYGFLYSEEAERLLGGGQVAEDRTALALARSTGPEPLSPHEVFAIQSGALGDVHLSSSGRRIDLRPDLLPWARANRDRLRRLVGTFGETDLFVLSWGGTTLTETDNAIVGIAGGEREITHGLYGHTSEVLVIALNDRARQVLGAEPEWVVVNEMRTIAAEELEDPSPP